ncbi:MAG: hypothetical protein U0802_16090 [Candidatus Binatia bacterium]
MRSDIPPVRGFRGGKRGSFANALLWSGDMTSVATARIGDGGDGGSRRSARRRRSGISRRPAGAGRVAYQRRGDQPLLRAGALPGTVVGAVAAGATGWLTAGNHNAADDIFGLFDGTQVVTPDIIENRERFTFSASIDVGAGLRMR